MPPEYLSKQVSVHPEMKYIKHEWLTTVHAALSSFARIPDEAWVKAVLNLKHLHLKKRIFHSGGICSGQDGLHCIRDVPGLIYIGLDQCVEGLQGHRCWQVISSKYVKKSGGWDKRTIP